jgi:hypothetical protein
MPGSDFEQLRAVKTQSVQREVNERLRALAGPETSIDFECECARGCCRPVPLTRDDYERVRQVPTHFLVTPGHNDHELERVATVGDDFFVVEKLGAGAAAAARLDPRSRLRRAQADLGYRRVQPTRR